MKGKCLIILSFFCSALFIGCDFSSFLSEEGSTGPGGGDNLTVYSYSISKSNNPILNESITGLISGQTIYLSVPSEFSGTNTTLIPTINCNTTCSVSPDPSGGILFDDDFTFTLTKEGYQPSTYSVILYID